jgi:hypothetical protein
MYDNLCHFSDLKFIKSAISKLKSLCDGPTEERFTLMIQIN